MYYVWNSIMSTFHYKNDNWMLLCVFWSISSISALSAMFSAHPGNPKFVFQLVVGVKE